MQERTTSWQRSFNYYYYYYYYIRLTPFVGRHQIGKPFWILLQQEMMGWQWHQLDYMQIICTSLHTDNHASAHHSVCTVQAGCPSCRPTNRVKILLKAYKEALNVRNRFVDHGKYWPVDDKPPPKRVWPLVRVAWTTFKWFLWPWQYPRSGPIFRTGEICYTDSSCIRQVLVCASHCQYQRQ